MLSRSSFVCFRCQLRQSSHVPGRIPLVPLNRFENRRYGTAASLSAVDGAADGSGQNEPVLIRKITAAEPRRGRRGHGTGPGDAGSSQFFLSKGKRIYMKPEDLQGMETLGRPSEAIVMKDVGFIRRTTRASVEVEGEEHDNLVGVLDELAEERRDATAEEVQANIDELRPLDSDVIPERVFMEIAEVLHRGFTAAQLRVYIHNNLREDSERDGLGGNYPWVEDKTPWIPGRANTSSPTDFHLLGYVDKSTAPKRRMVMRLMRQCWGVSSRELNDRPGRLEVRIRDLEFSLLVLGTQRWLQIMARVFLESGGRIELFRQQKLLRITASRAQANAILADIDGRLRDVRTASFKAADFAPGHVSPAALEELGRVTHSVVARRGDDIQVSWINIESRDPGLEDIRDTVFRLLLAADAASKQQTCLHVHGGDKELRLVKDHTEKEKLPWYERLGPRGRWIEPKTPKRIAPVAFSWPPGCLSWGLGSTGAETPSDADSSPSPAIPEAEYQGWSDTPTITTTALFGHILHPCGPGPVAPTQHLARFHLGRDLSDGGVDGPAPEGQPSGGKLVDTRGPRGISPVIPTLAHLPANLSVVQDASSPTVVLRFVPQPDDASAASAPTLELELDASDSTNLQPKILRAVVESRHDDVLLPSRPTDVRLTQVRTFSVPGRSLPHLPFLAPLQRFLAASHLSLDQGNLATPARIEDLPMPARLLQAPRAESTHSEAPQDRRVTYLFAGLEMRRAVTSSLRGWPLLFTSIEAGRGGGRRLEISLAGIRPTSTGVGRSLPKEVPPDDHETSFLDAVTAALDGTELTWTSE